MTPAYGLHDETLAIAVLPVGAAGIDAGLTLTKIVRGADGALAASVSAAGGAAAVDGASAVGLTGARASQMAPPAGARLVPEIEAAARGVLALQAATGDARAGDFVLALLGTGTAFALLPGDERPARVTHLGGTPLGGGSFCGIARRIVPGVAYEDLIAGASRGDRRVVDTMISEAYQEGIGRVGGDLTAAHLASPREGTPDDVLAGLLNLHAENIAQIAASRARLAGVTRIVVAGGFAHANATLTDAIVAMCALFGVRAEVPSAAGYAGAIGAALVAVEASEGGVSA